MLLPASHDLGASAFTWPAALFLWGPGSWSDLHRHHCVQLVMALDGTLRFRQRPRQPWTTCDGVLVRADAWHEVNARGTNVLIAFVDAESELGAALAEGTTTDVAPIPIATVGEWRRQLGDSASLTAARVEPWVTGTLLRDRRPPSIDHRVKRVLRDLPSRLADAEAVSLCSPQASACLHPDFCTSSRHLSAFPCARMSSGCACNVAPVSSRAASPSPTRPTRRGSPMRHTSRGRFVA
jgi:hypothetical protein